MAEPILIVGPSGSGKTTSTENMPKDSTFYISSINKRISHLTEVKRISIPDFPREYTVEAVEKSITSKLPEDTMWVSTDKSKVQEALIMYIDKNRPDIKAIIVDDWQYVFANHFMRRVNEKSFNKFNDIGHEMWSMANISDRLTREDLIIYFLTHVEDTTDADGNKSQKAKTIGKMVDNILTLEGMFEVVIYTETTMNQDKKIEYNFRTKTSGNDSAKTPKNMFNEVTTIPNDLTIIDKRIREFYKLEKTEQK